MEKAAPIPGYEDYTITATGEVRHHGKLLKSIPSKRGKSARVKLRADGKVIAVAVPKLVALAHVSNPNNHTHIILIDRSKDNYHADNIRWVSLSDSIRYNQRRIGVDGLSEESSRNEDAAFMATSMPVPGHEGYSVTPDGNVYCGNRRLLGSPGKNNRAARVKVRDAAGQPVRITIAKLVALAFLPNPGNHTHVVFRDRDKTNCHMDNLRWVSSLEYGRFVHGCEDLDALLGISRRPPKEPDWIDPGRVPVKGFPGYYITRSGVFYHGGRILSPSRREGKSLKVRARLADGSYRYFGLALLVAEHFLPNPKRHRHVIFKDRDNHNCHADNIAWVDSQTFIYYCGIIQGAKKRVLPREEAIRKCADPYLRKYYGTLDESWLTECWAELEKRMTMHDWDACRSECYLYFIDRARRFSILKDPVGLMLFYARGVRSRIRQEISAYMPYRAIVRTDESLRDIRARVEE